MKKIEIKKGTNIEYLSRELLFLAQSGQPYRGVVYVRFVSKGETFDLVDFKRYITSLRDTMFNSEDIAFSIYDKIDMSIKTKNLGVIVDITSRGGIQQRLSFGKSFVPTSKDNIFQV